MNIYVDGTFDLLHLGHISFFKKIKNKNDKLIVGVISDKNVESYKRKPILNTHQRSEMLRNIKIVDKVIEDCPFGNIDNNFLKKYKINKIYYAGDDISNWEKHYKIAIDRNILEIISYNNKNLSTTKIINEIKKG